MSSSKTLSVARIHSKVVEVHLDLDSQALKVSLSSLGKEVDQVNLLLVIYLKSSKRCLVEREDEDRKELRYKPKDKTSYLT